MDRPITIDVNFTVNLYRARVILELVSLDLAAVGCARSMEGMRSRSKLWGTVGSMVAVLFFLVLHAGHLLFSRAPRHPSP